MVRNKKHMKLKNYILPNLKNKPLENNIIKNIYN